ncbi:SLC13 family permease [Inmirania thermothiophila]|uniref:YbiR family transporter n=1 Tax=Inmirania thermothiophila TaxID=1750597 RepID=A0A3N1Y9L8_9GAMM|nr:SLC13 family permease [Inmirania thermothiophila]ROR35188.1 YbiR family transporter [Inmirania thermothiophila]
MAGLAVLVATFGLVLLRRLGPLRLAIWQVMAAGAAAAVLTGAIGPAQALRAIDLEVIAFLAGMFLIGEGLARSGLLQAGAHALLARTRSADGLVLGVVLTSGVASALLMNDTLAVVGTPLALHLAREHRLPPRLLLLALAYGITTGSVMSPIGNPQNLLIATQAALPQPFLAFLAGLGPATLLALLLAWLVLRLAFPGDFRTGPLTLRPVVVSDRRLALLAAFSMAILVVLVLGRIALAASGLAAPLPLGAMALVAAAPLLASPRRRELIRGIDWHTLLFFACLFIVVAAAWRSPLVRAGVEAIAGPARTPAAVLAVSAGLSQVLSNVPLVALYLPLLHGAGTETLLALAAGSTVAGNLLFLGAASNVIIVQRAARAGQRLRQRDFVRAGAPLTLLQLLLYWAFLR